MRGRGVELVTRRAARCMTAASPLCRSLGFLKRL
jgi:hypothetical protein